MLPQGEGNNCTFNPYVTCPLCVTRLYELPGYIVATFTFTNIKHKPLHVSAPISSFGSDLLLWVKQFSLKCTLDLHIMSRVNNL
jgi:hypothetical protein